MSNDVWALAEINYGKLAGISLQVASKAAELASAFGGTSAAVAMGVNTAAAAEELGAVPEYDYTIVNDDLAHAVTQVSAILDAETKRVTRQNGLGELVAGLRREIEKAKTR